MAAARLLVIACAVSLAKSRPDGDIMQLIQDHYPSQVIVGKLSKLSKESINIDGHLNDPAWADAPWLDNFLDLAGPRFRDVLGVTWQEASRDYAKRFTGDGNPTRVKLRWDADFLYVGAELRNKHVAASVTGHCDDLKSSVWKNTPVLPYFDDDFEVFLNPSQNNYFYVEYEMNAKNATYSTLWTLPQAGLGSVAPECGGGDGPRRVCCNTTWNDGKGLCNKPPVETEAGTWTMEMYDEQVRPGTGLLSAVANLSDRWTLEVRFPILSNQNHGGIINLGSGMHYPNSNPARLHPESGQRFWGATFANALHAPWWADLNASTVSKHPELIKSKCTDVIEQDMKQNGFSQFLIDGNNAAPTCYYEAASQNLGGHQYMHNPDNFGYLQFEEGLYAPKVCRNVLWPARFILAQLYQAEVQYLSSVKLGNGSYTAKLDSLFQPNVCTIDNACNITALQLASRHFHIELHATEGATTGHCARYAVGEWQRANWTGGPCFNASVTYTIQNQYNPIDTRHIMVRMNEDRLLTYPDVGQRWNDEESAWACLDTINFLAEKVFV